LYVIPAVDLMGGRAVRLRQGRRNEVTTYFEDPVEPALAFVQQGAEILHVVDLDGAFEGESKNLDSVRRIVEAVGSGVLVELGGGIRSLGNIERALALGVGRVILGTAVLSDPGFLAGAVEKFGSERIVLGLDAVEGKVAVRGWEEVTGQEALELACKVRQAGAVRIIYTDIAKDGMLGGPNLEALKRIAACGLAVIASGGIATLEHVRRVAGLKALGIEGMIIGKALYEGKIKLSEAISAVEEVTGSD